MNSYKNLLYTGANGRQSPFDLMLSDNSSHDTLVVFAHGYKGFKDWGAWDLVGKAFADAGLDFLKFNFTHNGGTVDNPINFPDLDAFSENTYSKELVDLNAISELITQKGISVEGKNRKWKAIALIGHSRGGGMVVLHASRNPLITKLATWAAVANFGERFKFDLEAWERDGITYVINGRTKQEMPHKYAYYQDFIQHEAELSIEYAAKKIEIPWLVVHGTADEAVTFDNAERLVSWGKKAKLITTAGIGHTFGAIHPWPKKKLPEALQKVVDRTIEHFKG